VRRRIMDYCRQDVVVENGVKGRIGLLSEAEQRVWQLDQSINRRGVRLDLAFVAACQTVVDKASAPLRAEFQDLTGLGKVGSPKLLDWCLENGTKLDNLQKKTLAKLLDMEEDDGSPDAGYGSLAGENDDNKELCGSMYAERLPSAVRRVLEIRQMLGGAAIKKLKRMQACCGYDGRARGLLQYHAAHSGRWGGRLLQPQNFPRDTIKGCDPERAVDAILSGNPAIVERELGLHALDAVARSLRHALVADEGKVFVVGDYAQIEARIVLALAGQYDKTELIAAGQSPYLDFGAIMFGRPISKDINAEYIPSKAGVLGCGFQCGPENFNIKFLGCEDIATSELVVNTYRKEWAPKVPQVWYGLERASLNAVQDAKPHEAYGVVYKRDGEFLRCDLPSGWQHLWYYGPALGESRFGNLAWNSMQSKQGKWIKVDMYGGLETENVDQALARGLLVEAMFRVEKAGMPIVLTCHDEIMVEVDEDKADEVQFKQLMIQSRPWAEEMRIPVDAEVWTGTRYRK
jgi:DNA polymerase bacteriophage-type